MFPGRLTYFYCNRTSGVFPPVLRHFSAHKQAKLYNPAAGFVEISQKSFLLRVITYIMDGYPGFTFSAETV